MLTKTHTNWQIQADRQMGDLPALHFASIN